MCFDVISVLKYLSFKGEEGSKGSGFGKDYGRPGEEPEWRPEEEALRGHSNSRRPKGKCLTAYTFDFLIRLFIYLSPSLNVFLLMNQILLLDEPTAGMDPVSRHQVWSLLKSRRAGRVTVLSTHYMDEADILAGTFLIFLFSSISHLYLSLTHLCGFSLTQIVKLSSLKDN